MIDLWDTDKAGAYGDDLLGLRVYSSQLLGREAALVLHGGGNTSVKIKTADPVSGRMVDALYVKGSGWDLATIEKQGFAPVKLDALLNLASRDTLSDRDMVDFQRISMLDANAPNPSIEAIVHALIPYTFVDHTHSDSVVTLTNNPNAASILKEIYGSKIAILPYVMPGFVLAKAMGKLLEEIDIHKIEGIILLNHGIFTFGNSARESYERMIGLVSLAEEYIQKRSTKIPKQTAETNLLELARLRKSVSKAAKWAVYCNWDKEDQLVGFSSQKKAKDWVSRGTLTPDHVIRTKKSPLYIEGEIENAVEEYVNNYKSYFERNNNGSLTCLNKAPRWAVWPGRGFVSFGASPKEAGIVMDIARQTAHCIWNGEQIGGWLPLDEKQLFEIEYWELEQAKLKKAVSSPELTGKIALVTGAASGIGKAVAECLFDAGCAVVALDLNPQVESLFLGEKQLGLVCDVSDSNRLKECIDTAVYTFGGLDIVVNNAGVFTAGQYIENIEDELWEKSLKLNLTAAQQVLKYSIPYLKEGIDPSVIIIASRNVNAPGPGAGAYSVAKAGLTQLGRVAALELAEAGIRVNMVHPDAVFDTGLWTAEVLKRSAKRYGISVEEYKRKNLMKTEIASKDVGLLVCSLATKAFAKTTGAQIPIDGGNERVI